MYENEKLKKRCCNCFKLYDDLDGMCPHCGFVEDESGKELYYLVPGTVLKASEGTEYIIGEAVGAGGFGITYKAWDKKLECIVAIKEYFPPSMVSRGVGEQKVAVFSNKKAEEYKKGLADFLKEATIMSHCADCDNVCNSYNRFEANGTAYMVMEFLSGKTLKAYVKNKKEQLKESEIVSIIVQTLNGLKEIHKRGIVHLDIAPDNIYVMPDGTIKISDFGAACFQKSPKGMITVKPGFAPPEQYLENAKLGVEADIYAVGANLYWMLTGEVPLEATDRLHEDILEEPAKKALLSSPALNNITMRAMALKPELRYKNCQDFITALRKEKERTLEQEIRRRKRNRREFLTAIVITLFLAIAGTGYFGILRNKIWEDSIVIWVASEASANQMAERERYEKVVELFQETYPQLSVEIVVKDESEIENAFLNTSKEERPDVVEITSFSETAKEELKSVSSIMSRCKMNLVLPLQNALLDKNIVPIGFYVDVIYAENGKELAQLESIATLTEYIQKVSGYYVGSSKDYFAVQAAMAGRYQIKESTTQQIHIAEEFGVYERNNNKKKAAMALVEYFLTDAAQDVLHIQTQSGFMPVTENAWKEFVSVYGEFAYLENSLGEYSLK